jgi:hypothetical protein
VWNILTIPFKELTEIAWKFPQQVSGWLDFFRLKNPKTLADLWRSCPKFP